MSYAVIKTGGKQYKVKSGEILKIEKLPETKIDTKIEFNEVLAYGDNKLIEIGDPIVKGARVEANLIKNSKNRTILIFKKRRRQNSRRKNGHRQEYSLIRVEKILLILISEYSCRCPFFLLEFCLRLFLNIKTVLFLLFLIKFASTFEP